MSLPVQCSDDDHEQSVMYNGYYHDTMTNNVLAFSPKGIVLYACLNFPGSWHDSQVAASFIEKVRRDIGVYAFCVDQGFPRSGDLYDKLVGPLSRKARAKLAPNLRHALLRRHAKCISLRQAAEWGMRALQGTFSRLKSSLPSCKFIRGKILLAIVLVHNFRTHHVGLNQIATVFNPLYEEYVNVEGYDHIARYFM